MTAHLPSQGRPVSKHTLCGRYKLNSNVQWQEQHFCSQYGTPMISRYLSEIQLLLHKIPLFHRSSLRPAPCPARTTLQQKISNTQNTSTTRAGSQDIRKHNRISKETCFIPPSTSTAHHLTTTQRNIDNTNNTHNVREPSIPSETPSIFQKTRTGYANILAGPEYQMMAFFSVLADDYNDIIRYRVPSLPSRPRPNECLSPFPLVPRGYLVQSLMRRPMLSHIPVAVDSKIVLYNC